MLRLFLENLKKKHFTQNHPLPDNSALYSTAQCWSKDKGKSHLVLELRRNEAGAVTFVVQDDTGKEIDFEKLAGGECTLSNTYVFGKEFSSSWL